MSKRKLQQSPNAPYDRFRTLFEQSMDAIYIGTLEGGVIDVNQSWLDLFGYSREDLPSIKATDLYADPVDRVRLLQRMAEVGAVKDEILARRKDGSAFLCQRSMVAQKDADGAVVAIQGVNRDVSALRAAEDALRDRELRFRSLFEQSMDAIYITAPGGSSIEANQAWLDLFGYSREELAAINAIDIYAEPADRAEFLRRIGDDGFVRDEVRLKRKDGTVFDSERTVVPVKDGSGNVTAYQGIIHDISERKRAEDALSVELAWRRILLEQSRDGIVVLDQDGKVVEANVKVARMLGYSPEEVLQLHVQDWDVPTPREKLEEMIRDVDESGDHFETQHRRKDGTVYDVEISTNAAVFGEQKLVFCVCRDITERKRVQKALEQGEARLRFLTEHTADIIWTMDMELRTTYMSPSVERVLGFTAEEWMRLRFDEVATPESVSREYAELQIQLELEASGTADPNRTLTLEIEMYHKNGSTVWMELAMRAIRDDAGKLVGMVGVSRDITERRKTISALRESEQRLSQLARHSRAVAWEVDLDGLFTYVSPVVEEVLGPQPDDLVGKRHFYDLIPTEGREEVKVRALSAIRAGADITDVESPMARADGGLLWVAISGVPLRNSDGALVGYRGWVIDITARKTAELTLRTSEQRFRTLFEQSVDAIYVVDYDGSNIRANPAWLTLFGYTLDELPQHNIIELYVNPDDRRNLLKAVARTGTVEDEVRFKKKDGTEFDCARSVTAQRDVQGNIVAFQGIMRDVTEQRRVHVELERLARFDSLTGILNRRLILEKVDEWIVQTRRYKGHLSVVMLDIDHFKQVNDRYGHQVGDRVLADTAHLLQRSLRQTDFVGRYGGEEFLLVLPQTDAAGAAIIAERARVILQGTAMHGAEGDTYGITASFGVAEWRDGNDVDALVGRADAALFRAKEAGRNRVEVAPLREHAPPEK